MYTDNFNYIILWGHSNFKHTHSYIHYGFYKAFKYLGYKCLWIDDNNKNYDLKKSLFITEGQVDNNIPLLNDSFYILHNCNNLKYNKIPKKNIINLQVFTLDCIFKHKAKKLPFENGYYLDDCIIISWATDLLPYEINENIFNLDKINKSVKNEINFIGMSTDKWNIVENYCNKNNILYRNYGGFNLETKVSSKQNMDLIQHSIIAPSIQSNWQIKNSYIPCRIFKNISYGKMGLSNNYYVYELFDKKILYDNNIEKLCEKGIKYFLTNNNNLLELMITVRDKHTYVNRINAIFWLINLKN